MTTTCVADTVGALTAALPSATSPRQFLGEVAYVGMHSLGLFANQNLNETPDSDLSNTVNVPNPFLGLLPPASTLGQGSTVRATSAPSWAKIRAVARPMPPAAPVTRTRDPFSERPGALTG
jgi:hypothetical protein